MGWKSIGKMDLQQSSQNRIQVVFYCETAGWKIYRNRGTLSSQIQSYPPPQKKNVSFLLIIIIRNTIRILHYNIWKKIHPSPPPLKSWNCAYACDVFIHFHVSKKSYHIFWIVKFFRPIAKSRFLDNLLLDFDGDWLGQYRWFLW